MSFLLHHIIRTLSHVMPDVTVGATCLLSPIHYVDRKQLVAYAVIRTGLIEPVPASEMLEAACANVERLRATQFAQLSEHRLLHFDRTMF
jgi:hypothetical protein